MQSYQIFFSVRLVLWISSLSRFNVETGAVLIVTLAIRQSLKEIYVLPFTGLKAEKCKAGYTLYNFRNVV